LTFHAASLYPLLYRLEKRGWIEGRWTEKAGERRKRVYKLTREVRRCSRSTGTDGKPSFGPSARSSEGNMPDWAGEIRRRLAPHGLRPTREMEIVEEIAQHLEQRYSRLRARGASDDEAQTVAWNELDESDVLGSAIARVERPAPLALPPPGAASGRGWSGSLWQDVRSSAVPPSR
jgi:hypothetical protein